MKDMENVAYIRLISLSNVAYIRLVSLSTPIALFPVASAAAAAEVFSSGRKLTILVKII